MHRNRQRASFIFLTVVLLICVLSTSTLLNANYKTGFAAESLFYDFIAEASSASWASGAGSLPFPGSDNDSRGFALYRDNWQLEDNSIRARVLETHPQWVSDGWIMGKYPQVTVPPNAQVEVIVGFLKGATGSDGVTFEVQFEEGQTRQTILSCKATYDGKLDIITQSLDSLAGRTGHFILYVNAGQSSGQDWAAWAEARIEAVAPPELPDLVVTGIECGSGNKLSVTIKNIGSGALPSGWSAVAEAYFDGEKKGSFDLRNPTSTIGGGIEEPGGSSTYLLAWEITAPTTVMVIADSTDDITESNEQNNSKEEEVEPLVTELPDLVIEEIRCDQDNNRIGYMIKNVGEAVASSGHTTTLYVDGKEIAHDLVGVDLQPGATHESWFEEYKWLECKTIEVRVCADNHNQVKESDEQNNCKEQACQCIADVTPPRIISGPTISQVTQTSAVICWQTDEASDSLVRYDNRAGKYGGVIEDSDLVEQHCLTLTKLESATTYHFVVESRDSSGNKVMSRDFSFQTAFSPDEEKPSVSVWLPDKLSGRVPISADAQDNIGVDRVVFIVDGKPVHTDYTPPFDWNLDTRGLDDGAHILTIQAFDTIGNMVEVDRDAIVQNRFLPDESPVLVTIENPEPHSGVYGWIDIEATITHEYGSCIQHAEIEISSTRSEREVVYSQDDLCLPWPGPGSPPPSPPMTVRYAYDIRELEPGTEVVIEVRGRDEFGNEGHANVLVTVVEPPPVELPLDIHRSVTRHGNYFHVELTLRNTGTETVRDFTVIDKSKGFQGVRNPDLVISYDCDTKQTSAKQTVTHFGPGDTCTLSYDLVPVLFHPLLHNYDYCIGESRLDVSYKDEFGREYSGQYPSPEWGRGSEIDDAFRSADYLIVTNPHHLFDQNAVGDVNMLLSTMADLAKEKQGVLGYLPEGATAGEFDRLIDARNSGDDRWFLKLCDGWLTNGYLLIVGETEIVPAFTIVRPTPGGDRVTIPLSDNPYADSCSHEDRPDLRVGRIIGNTAYELAVPIRVSIDVSRGTLHQDHSDALVVVSHSNEVEYFIIWAAPLVSRLPSSYAMVTEVDWEYQDTEIDLLREALAILGTKWDLDDETDRPEPPAELSDLRDLVGRWDFDDDTDLPEPPDDLAQLRSLLSVSDAERVEAAKRGEPVRHYNLHPSSSEVLLARAHLVRDHAYDKDLICYVGHGGSGSWVWGLDEPHLDFIGFGSTAPVVFASACETGDYEAGWNPDEGIAEAFLQRGAGAYIGATVVVNGGSADEIQRQFCLNEWTPGRSVGEALLSVKRNLMDIETPEGPSWTNHAYLWNLYGDPKFGG